MFRGPMWWKTSSGTLVRLVGSRTVSRVGTIISGGLIAARNRRRRSWWNQAVSQAADEGLAVPHSEPGFSLSLFLSPHLSDWHTYTHLCFLPAFFPSTCGPLAQLASVDYSSLTAIMILHKQHLSAHLSLFPPGCPLSSIHLCSISASLPPGVKMHVTSTTENNPQKSPVIFAQICKCQR